MDEITALMDKLATYEPTKTFLELAREHPEIPGLRQLASMEAMAAQQSATSETPKPEQT